MRKGRDYIDGLANGKQIAREVGELLDVDDCDYNCGGFALGIPIWYLPYPAHDRDYGYDESESLDDYAWAHPELLLYNGREYARACTGRGRIMVNYMVDTNLNIREVKSSKEVQDDEYLVLFRASGDDFHFIRRMGDGTWAHKMGSNKITTIKNGEVEKAWHNFEYNFRLNYQGKVFLLAVKKEELY